MATNWTTRRNDNMNSLDYCSGNRSLQEEVRNLNTGERAKRSCENQVSRSRERARSSGPFYFTPFSGFYFSGHVSSRNKGCKQFRQIHLAKSDILNSQFKDIHCLREALQEGIRSF